MKRHAEETTTEELSDEQRQLYDRQIRLWGLDAQKRLSKFRVCIAGLTGLGAEVAKNVILAGLGHVHLLDDKNVTEEDFRSQFMVVPGDLGKNRAQSSLGYAKRLNPMVDVEAEENNIENKMTKEFLGQFDLVVVCEMLHVQKLFNLNEICRQTGVKLIVGHIVAGFGFFISDLLDKFEFVNESVQYTKEGKRTKHEQKVESYPEMKRILQSKFVNKRSGSALTKRSNRVAFQFHLIFEYFNSSPEVSSDGLVNPTKENLVQLLPQVAKRLEVEDESRFGVEVLDELLNHEPGPVSAVLGGVLGQEVVKIASANCQPFSNVFLFDALSCIGAAEKFKDF